jgi:hypothetical protein
VTGHLAKGLRVAAALSIAIVVLAGGCDHPRSTPEGATAASYEVSQVSHTLIGKQITIRGKFSSLTKGSPYVVLLDNQQEVYLESRVVGPKSNGPTTESRGSFTSGDPYSKMNGKLVEATGTLRFYHDPEPVDEARPQIVQRVFDHFYLKAETAQLRIISR